MLKSFFEVFSDLELTGSAADLMGRSQVAKVSMNLRRDRIKIFLEADCLIGKDVIYLVQEEIRRQIFSDGPIEVRIIEKFHLSGQYSARKLMPLYEDSIYLELRNYSVILYDLMRQGEYEFTDEDTMILRVADSCVSQRSINELQAILEKIFCERCGQDLKLTIETVEMKESHRRELANLALAQQVQQISRRALASSRQKEGTEILTRDDLAGYVSKTQKEEVESHENCNRK